MASMRNPRADPNRNPRQDPNRNPRQACGSAAQKSIGAPPERNAPVSSESHPAAAPTWPRGTADRGCASAGGERGRHQLVANGELCGATCMRVRACDGKWRVGVAAQRACKLGADDSVSLSAGVTSACAYVHMCVCACVRVYLHVHAHVRVLTCTP